LSLRFPESAYFKRNYVIKIVYLDIKPKLIPIVGDRLSVISSLTTADLSKVKIGFNSPPSIPLNEVASGVTTPFHEIFLTWEDSENGKTITFLIGQEARFTVSTQGVTISGDYVGLAKENTLDEINNKLKAQSSDIFVKDLSVGTTAVQLDTDSTYREAITILADEGNSDIVKIGDSNNQLFPLKAGASITIRKTSLNLIYAIAVSGTQTLHIIAGGS